MSKQQNKPDPTKKKSILDTDFGLSDNKLSNKSFISDSKFDDRYNPNMGSLDEFKTLQQTSMGAFGNKLAQIALKVLPGATEQLSYSVDLENALTQDKNNYDNALGSYLRGLKEDIDETFPVYRNREETFNWADPKFYIDNLGDVVESVGEFALAGAAIATVTGGAGAALVGSQRTKGLLSGLIKAGGFVEKGISATVKGASSLALAHAVGGLQGSQVFKSTYEKAIRSGMDVAQAEQLAGESAATTYSFTVLSTGLLNATSLAPFFRAGRLGQLSLPKRGKGQDLSAFSKSLKDLKADPKGQGNKALTSYLGLVGESAQEALEETGELFAQRLGEKQTATALGEDYEINMFDDEAQLSALLGAVGGFGMKGGAQLVARVRDKGRDEKRQTLYQELIDEKTEAIDKHISLIKEMKNLREAILDPAIDFNAKNELNTKLRQKTQELQANAIGNALNEETESAIEQELEMYSSMTDEQALETGLDTDPNSPNHYKTVAEDTKRAIKNIKQRTGDIKRSSLPKREKVLASRQVILAEMKAVDLDKAKRSLANKYAQFAGTLDESLMTQSKTYNKLLAYKELLANTKNPILREKYKENIEVLENQIDSELDLLSALKKPVDLQEEQAVLFEEKKKKERTNLKKNLNNPEITALERDVIELDSEIQLLNDAVSQITSNGDRKDALIKALKEEEVTQRELSEIETSIDSKLDSIRDRFNDVAIKDKERNVIAEEATEARNSLDEFRKEAKKLPKDRREAAYKEIDAFAKALDGLIKREKDAVKRKNVATLNEKREQQDRIKQQEAKETKEKKEAGEAKEAKDEAEETPVKEETTTKKPKKKYVQDYSEEEEGDPLVELEDTDLDPIEKTTIPTETKVAETKTEKKKLQTSTSGSLPDMQRINTTLSEWKSEKFYDKESIDKAIREGRKVYIDNNKKKFVWDFVYDENMQKVQKTFNGEPLQDVFDTTDGILTINSPNTKVGDKVFIIKEEGFGGFNSTNPDDVPLNVYKAEDVVDGFPVEGAKPLTQLPSKKSAIQRGYTSATMLRTLVTSSPFAVEATISDKNKGDINYEYTGDKNTESNNSLNTLKTTWIKENNKWRIGEQEENPVLGYGVADTIIVPNSSSLSQYQKERLEDSGYIVNDKGEMVLYLPKKNDFFNGKHVVVVPGVTGDMTATNLHSKRVQTTEAMEMLDNLDSLLTTDKKATKRKITKSVYLGKFIKQFNERNKKDFSPKGINYTTEHIYIQGNAGIARISRKNNGYSRFLNDDNYKGVVFLNKDTFEIDADINIEVEKVRQLLFTLLAGQTQTIDSNLLNSDTAFEEFDNYYEYIEANELLTTNVKAGEHGSNATIYLDVDSKKQNKAVVKEQENTQVLKDTRKVKLDGEPAVAVTEDDDLYEGDYNEGIENSLDENSPVFKPFREGNFKSMSKKEVNWFKEIIGENYLSIAQRVDRVKANGQQAFGYYQNAMVTIAEFAEVGTAYHEAFHFVFNMSTSSKEKSEILAEARELYGKNLTALQLEEKLAEDFEKFKVTGDLPVKKAKGFFSYVLEFINKLLNKTNINDYFNNINNGKYTGKTISRNTPFLQNQSMTKLVDGFTNISQKMVVDSIDYQLMNILSLEEIQDNKKVNTAFDEIERGFATSLGEAKEELRYLSFVLEEIPYKDTNVLAFIKKNGTGKLEKKALGDNVEEVRKFISASRKVPFLKALLNGWNDTEINNNKIEGFRTKALKNLRVHGFDVEVNGSRYAAFSENENDENQSDETREEEDGTQDEDSKRIFDVSFTLRSVKKTLSSDLKRALSFMPNYVIENNKIKLDDNGEPMLNTVAYLGTPMYLSFDKIYNTLSTRLANVPITEIEDTLKELSEKDTSLVVVYEWLTSNKSKPIYNKFLSFFDKYNYKYITMINDKGTPKLVETNRESLEKIIVDDWINNMERKGIVSYDLTTEEPVISKMDLTAEITDLKKLLTNPKASTKEALDLFNEITNKIGIEIGGNLSVSEMKQLTYGKLDRFVNDLSKGLNILEENTILTDLAIEASKYSTDMFNSSFRNGNGDQVYAINLKNSLVEDIAFLKDRNNLEDYTDDHFYKNNSFIKILMNDKHSSNLDVFLFDSIKTRERGRGKDFKTTNVTESYLSDMIAYSAQLENSDYFLLNIGSISDKPQSYYLKLPKLSVAEGMGTFDATKSVMMRTMYQEIIRIKRSTNKAYKLKIKDYSERSKKFVYLPFLNSILLDDKGNLKYDLNDTKENLQKLRDVAEEAINNYLNEQYKLFTDSLVSNNILDSKLKPVEEYKRLLGKINLQDFFFNDLVWKQETGKVLMGDLAFYANKNVYNKRSYQLATPGTKINDTGKYNQGFFDKQLKINTNDYLLSLAQLVDNKIKIQHIRGGVDSRFVSKEDAETREKDVEALNKLSKKQKRVVSKIVKYKQINKTDAQSYISLAFYKRILEGVGDWSEDHNYMYEKYWKDGKKVTLGKDKIIEAKLLLQPLKPFRFSKTKTETGIEGVSQIVPMQIKDSMFPILPIMANNNKGMKEILDAMNERSVDVYSAADAVKVGLSGSSFDLSKSKIHSLSLEDFRMPLSIPTVKKTNLYGTQLGKLTLANIDDDVVYVLPSNAKITGQKLKSLFHNSWDKRIQDSFNSLKEELGFNYEDGEISLPAGKGRLTFLINLRNKLEKENESRDLSDNYFDALQIVKEDIYRFSTDLSFPTISQRYETVILSLFKNEVIKQKFEGFSNVNVADYGIGYDDELKFITNDNGEIIEAEIALPFELASKVGISEKNYGADGKIDWDTLTENQKKALQIIAYRIPTQGKNSMIPARVVKVLPKSSGSAIMVPGEGTMQGGFDFDVDKTFMMFRQVDDEGNVVDYGDVSEQTTKENNNEALEFNHKDMLKELGLDELLSINTPITISEKEGLLSTEHGKAQGKRTRYSEGILKGSTSITLSKDATLEVLVHELLHDFFNSKHKTAKNEAFAKSIFKVLGRTAKKDSWLSRVSSAYGKDSYNESSEELAILYLTSKEFRDSLPESMKNKIEKWLIESDIVSQEQLDNYLSKDLTKKINQSSPKTNQSVIDKLKNKLQKLYPEIKLTITNNPKWEQGKNVLNQEDYDNRVKYNLKASTLLASDKAEQVFAKGEKNGWDLNKILTELAIPKEQKQIILDKNTNTETFSDAQIEAMIQSGEITFTEDDGKPCAKMGMKSDKFTKGGKWEKIKEFKGASHERGGIDIEIGNGGIKMSNKQGKFEAKFGLVINKKFLR